MGGLLRVPKVPSPAPAVAAAAPADQPAADQGGDRRRRGLAATIATSDRGVSDSRLPVSNRKTLLGE
jgi:hypothetical protein